MVVPAITTLDNPDILQEQSLRDVIHAVENDPSLGQQQRRDLISAIRKVATLIGVCGLDHPANPSIIAAKLRVLSPAMLGVSRESMSNIRWRFRKAFEIAGIPVYGGKHYEPLLPEWQTLQSMCTEQYWWTISGFAHFSSAKGYLPSEITICHLESFRDTLSNDAIHPNPKAAFQRLRRTWNKVASLPGSTAKPVPIVPERTPYVIAEELFPESLRDEIATYFARRENPPPFQPWSRKATSPFCRPRSKPIAPRTAQTQKYELRQYLSALLHTGTPLAEMTSLRVVITAPLVERGLTFFWERAGRRMASQIHQIGWVVLCIARHHLKDTELAGKISSMLSNATPRREMAETVQVLMRQFDDRRNHRALLNLPNRLAKIAQRLRSTSHSEASRMSEAALAINIMIFCPMRIGNIAKLHLDRNFSRARPDQKGKIHLVISAEDAVKTKRAIEFELPSEVASMLETHVSTYRLHVPGSANRWLFPATSGKHVEPSTLSKRLCRLIRSHTGIRMRAHMFRHIAAEMYENADRRRQLLGHASVETSSRFYTRRNMSKAVKLHSENVLKARNGL